MPAKSKRGKGKHPHQSKKSKTLQRQTVMAEKSSVAADKPVPETTVDKVTVPRASHESAQVVQNPYIINELRKVGILAVIILVVLIILAVTLS